MDTFVSSSIHKSFICSLLSRAPKGFADTSDKPLHRLKLSFAGVGRAFAKYRFGPRFAGLAMASGGGAGRRLRSHRTAKRRRTCDVRVVSKSLSFGERDVGEC